MPLSVSPFRTLYRSMIVVENGVGVTLTFAGVARMGMSVTAGVTGSGSLVVGDDELHAVSALINITARIKR